MGFGVRIDKRSCLSSRRCVTEEPEGFDLDADFLGDVRAGAAALPLERLLEVARNCPGLAITVLDEDGREVDH